MIQHYDTYLFTVKIYSAELRQLVEKQSGKPAFILIGIRDINVLFYFWRDSTGATVDIDFLK